MLSRINEIKLLLDDDNIFKRGIQAENFKYVLTTEKEDEDIEEEHEVIEYNFENIYNSISFATTNVNNNQNLTFSLISKNPFEIFDSVIIPIINFIREINHLYRITIYTTGSQGSDEQYSILKDLNVSLYVVNDKKLISEEDINLILKYFPLTHFNFYLNPNNCNLFELWNYYKDFPNIYNLNFLLDYTKNQTEGNGFFEQLDNQLSTIDEHIINCFEKDNQLPLIPDFYRYMFWKIGVRDYFINQKMYKCIPESVSGIRCGQGCSKKLIFDSHGDIYSCCQNENDLFHLGNITDSECLEKMALKIENLLNTTLKLEFNEKLSVTKNGILQNDKCNQCELKTVCTKGCLPINYKCTGQLLTPPEAFCYWNQILYNHALKIVQHFDLYKNNQLFKEYYLGSIVRGEYYNVC